MKVESIKLGDKLTFMYPTSGYSADAEKVKDWLVGKILTVKQIRIEHWQTYIWFEEVDGVYNSVHFEHIKNMEG